MRAESASAPARSEECIDDVDTQQMRRRDVLIQPWSSTNYRLSSPADGALSSAEPTHHPASHPTPAIQSSQNTFTNNNGQDVHQSLNADSRPRNPSTPVYQHVQSPRILESPALPSPSPAFHNGPVNTTASRPRTNLPVYDTTSKLAAQYGIPTKLPPAPRVNSNNTINRPPVPRFNEATHSSPRTTTIASSQYLHPEPGNTNVYPDFQTLVAGYMKMLSDKPAGNGGAAALASPSFPLEPTAEEAAQTISHALFGGANDFTASTWDEFLTSPFLDDEPTPFESMLDTPAAPGMQGFFNSPLVADAGVLDGNFSDMPLFSQPVSAAYSDNNHDFAKMSVDAVPPPSSTASGSASPTKTAAPNFDGMYTMSPATPALDAPSMQTSPLVNDVSSASPDPTAIGRKKKVPTGTRKNVTPETLVPLNAPTQARKYVLPSTTSRKAVPAVFARKRARSAAFGGDEEDELAGSDGGAFDAPANSTEAEAIAAKRRQNTLAARRSRKRKLEYQQELEEGIEAERREKEMWRERALMLRAQVMQLGMPEPFKEA